MVACPFPCPLIIQGSDKYCPDNLHTFHGNFLLSSNLPQKAGSPGAEGGGDTGRWEGQADWVWPSQLCGPGGRVSL